MAMYELNQCKSEHSQSLSDEWSNLLITDIIEGISDQCKQLRCVHISVYFHICDFQLPTVVE
jgi:hypothetical protein